MLNVHKLMMQFNSEAIEKHLIYQWFAVFFAQESLWTAFEGDLGTGDQPDVYAYRTECYQSAVTLHIRQIKLTKEEALAHSPEAVVVMTVFTYYWNQLTTVTLI